jgi:hypothetical protein
MTPHEVGKSMRSFCKHLGKHSQNRLLGFCTDPSKPFGQPCFVYCPYLVQDDLTLRFTTTPIPPHPTD